ncbi:MAG: hypothetical protein ACRC5W_01795 [Cetobacterium sp.]|uniref:hypothetical protein n=1 Tax=Cetobacterium sp. TaxID=2071632 RepID=UPI003F2DFC8D
MNKIKKTFYKYWSKEKSDKFYETLESTILVYKIECLENFIEEIFEENPDVKRAEILKYARNMDEFNDSEEFLIDFFSFTRIPEGDSIVKKFKDNPEEIKKYLAGLLCSKKIKFKEKNNTFVVWYM